ncbi:MAG: hypothetical protein WC895_02645 [Candidatus Shapirobacteria bacterium]|jgi:hypothetical protein
MLPKQEKNKRLNQLVIDTEDKLKTDTQLAQKRIKTKRRLVLISLFLTVGLSLIFWSFRSLQKISISPPKINFNFKINLPKTNKNISLKNTNSSEDVDKYIKSLNNNWSIFISLVSKPNTPLYKYSPDLVLKDNNPDTLKRLSSIPTNTQSSIDLNLPQGLLFQEYLNSDINFTYQNIISLPKNKLLFLIKIDNPKNIDQVKQELPLLIDKIYWYSVSQIN